MSRRKRLLLIFGCLAAVLLAGYGTLRLTAPKYHRITEKNFEKIQKGMTEEEVEALLGTRAGVYSPQKTGSYFTIKHPWSMPSGLWLIQKYGGKEWVGKEIGIYVLFDRTGRVTESLRGTVREDGDESFLTKLRRWLGM
jgi:hypothetical protein